jgi:ribosomal protein S18 acetylase RimI-like enzyme
MVEIERAVRSTTRRPSRRQLTGQQYATLEWVSLQYFLFFATLVTLQLGGCVVEALVATTPSFISDHAQVVTNSETANVIQPLSVIIRKATISDVDEVASLLAMAVTVQSSYSSAHKQPVFNMKHLRIKADIRSQIMNRIKAVEEGNKIINRSSAIGCDAHDHSKMLWSNQSFRYKLERAVSLSTETHLWHRHHFAKPPKDPSILQHAMITAVNDDTGEVVGFVEIAMLPVPNIEASDDSTIIPYAPTIVNLVTCPEYRRRGIASTILESAKRYVKQQWDRAPHIGLKVDDDNAPAINLYRKHGFCKVTWVPNRVGAKGQFYLTYPFESPRTDFKEVRVLKSKIAQEQIENS